MIIILVLPFGGQLTPSSNVIRYFIFRTIIGSWRYLFEWKSSLNSWTESRRWKFSTKSQSSEFSVEMLIWVMHWLKRWIYQSVYRKNLPFGNPGFLQITNAIRTENKLIFLWTNGTFSISFFVVVRSYHCQYHLFRPYFFRSSCHSANAHFHCDELTMRLIHWN